MKIKCLIVDDEAPARKGLEKYAQQIDFLEIKGLCKNAMLANTLLNQETIDLLFLDIEMPMINGLNFLKSLSNPPRVIFTTAYSEYALDSFQFEVVDYLVKPISFERFLQAANKALKLFSKERPMVALPKAPEKVDDFIFIKTEKQLVKIFLKDILLVEALQNYVRIHTEKESYLTLVPLKKVSDLLPSRDFLQTHKSFVIAKSKVEAIAGNLIVIQDHKIPIGRSLKELVLMELLDNKVLKK